MGWNYKKSPENAVTPDEVQKDFEENQVLFYKNIVINGSELKDQYKMYK